MEEIEGSADLSEQELAKATELKAEIRRKLEKLLENPRTPVSFKEAIRSEIT